MSASLDLNAMGPKWDRHLWHCCKLNLPYNSKQKIHGTRSWKFFFFIARQNLCAKMRVIYSYDLGNHRSTMWFSTLLTFGTCFIIVNLIKFKINFISHYFSVHLVKRELNCAMAMPVKTRVIANCTVFVSIFLLNPLFFVHR